jgi:hypothetical protein
MKKEHLDLENRTVWIPDAKTPNGVAEVPLSEIAIAAFQSQLATSGPSPYLFPSDEIQTAIRRRSRPFDMRRCEGRRFSTSASTISARRTRPGSSAGGVADEWVTQLPRQGDAKVFEKYSQMKLQMKREALAKLNRQANEGGLGLSQLSPTEGGFDTVMSQLMQGHVKTMERGSINSFQINEWFGRGGAI